MMGQKLLLTLIAAAALPLAAQDLSKLPAKVTMPDGEVYHHPKVISRTPEGITIMHDTGVAFWKFTDLPESVRKKFHYDPKKAAAYRKEVRARGRRNLQMLAKKKMENDFEEKVVALNSQRYYVTELGFKIQDIERDLKQDGKDLPVAKSEERQDMNQEANIAENNNRGNTNYGGWGGAYSYNQGENTMGFSVKGVFDEDMKEQKGKIESLEFKRDWDSSSLPRLKYEYKKAKARLAKMEKEMAVIKKRYSSEEYRNKVKQVTNENYNQMQSKLEQLKQLCDKKLITPDEYIKKKEQLLSKFQ